MKKKVVLFLMLTLLFVCVMAVTVSAAEMTQYCDAKFTSTQNEEFVGYFKVTAASSGPVIDISKIYLTTDDAGEVFEWKNVSTVDMRDYNYFGCDAPYSIKEGSSSSKSPLSSTDYANITTMYLPDTIKLVPKSLCRDWGALNYLFIPKSVEVIESNAFRGSAVATVEFESGSNLVDLKLAAFRDCASLVSIELPSKLQSIGNFVFCATGLKDSFTVPASVTKLGNSVFLDTKIESLYFKGPLSLGTNIIGSSNKDKVYIKKIFIYIGTTFSTTPEDTWYPGHNVINFYVVSEGNEDTSEFIKALKDTGHADRLIFTTKEEIDNGNAPLEYNAVIYDSVSSCDAFNNGAHNQPGEATLVFENAFAEFYEAKQCIACNRFLPVGESYAPILSFEGYSTREDGTGFCVEYQVNIVSLRKFKEHESVKMGAIISVLGDETDTSGIVNVDENGNVTAINPNKTAVIDIPDDFGSFTFKISGFNLKDYSELNLVLCAYAYSAEKIAFLSTEVSEEPTAISINRIINYY